MLLSAELDVASALFTTSSLSGAAAADSIAVFINNNRKKRFIFLFLYIGNEDTNKTALHVLTDVKSGNILYIPPIFLNKT